jgi:Skp family chaperone for outer membrane proteins
MKHTLSSYGAIIALAIACVSCDKIKPPQPELQTPPATSGQPGQQEQERERSDFALAAQKELDELRAVIAELKTKAETANLQTRARLGEEVEKLDAELRAAQQQLMAFKSATDEAGKQLKEAFGKSLDKLKNGIDNFRKNAP